MSVPVFQISSERMIASGFRFTFKPIHVGKIMNKSQLKGRVKEVRGAIKEVVGKLLGNKELESRGKLQKTAGQVQSGYGDLKNDVSGNI